MERVSYAGDSFLTGSEIAHALLDYAQALAQAGQAATIEVPTVKDDGQPGLSEVLIGPSSQLVASDIDTDLPEPEDPALVIDMLGKATRLRSHSSPTAMPYTDRSADDEEFYTDYGI